jgi:hypothetical protein
MGNSERLKVEVIEGLKEILKLSLQHCNDGSPNEADFVAINKIAHECFKKVEWLSVEKAI